MKTVAEDTIRIQWVRSGIGFPRRQKRIVQSLGLRRLNDVVERPNTAQIRGLVASVPHLVEVVGVEPPPAWAAIPEYTMFPPEPEPERAEVASEPVPDLEVSEESAPSQEVSEAEAAPEAPKRAKKAKPTGVKKAVPADDSAAEEKKHKASRGKSKKAKK